MSIKEKVLTASKTSFAKYGLKSRELSTLVDQIIASRGLTEEAGDEDVKEAIIAFEPVVGLMQSMFNRAQVETEKKFDGWINPNDPKNKLQPPVDGKLSDSSLTAEQVQKMIAEAATNNQKAISEAVAAALAPFKEREEKARLTSLLQGNEKLKGIPEVFRSRYQLEKEEDLDNMVQRISDDYTALKQSLVKDGVFAEAPVKLTPEDEQEEFVKMMQGYSERNAPSPK